MAINIAQFRRPGIFIREIDASIQQTPVQDTIVNLVPGFSKKGPVNRPVLVSSPSELQEIFGALDRNLEKKGSYFHRTIQNILGQSPVFALNLLRTDDTLDLLEWKSISTSASIDNDPVLTDPYSAFFNKNEFWERDTEAFLNVANSRSNVQDKILHVTNMSDRPISLFVEKSPIRGFDVSAEEWFQGRDNVPTWMYPTDLISDTMVRITVVGGDWSNNQVLSVDPRWSGFFNQDGLRSSQVTNFINDPAVTLLAQYDVSLIPFFRDNNGTDYFIETVINRDTDNTGLFVSYDIDRLETENPNGLVDLIGHTLVGSGKETLDFLSYNEVIGDSITFEESPLDKEGNVFGEFLDYETKWLTSPDFCPVESSDPNDPNLVGVSRITLQNDAVLILNGVELTIESDQELEIPDVADGKIRKDTIFVDATGQLGVLSGIEVSNFTNWNSVPIRSVSSAQYPIAIVEVGTSQTSSGISGTSGSSFNGVWNCAVDVLENLTFSYNSTNSADIIVTNESSYEVLITFRGTRSTDSNTNYRKTRLQRIFDTIQTNLLVGSSIVATTSSGNKKILNAEFTTSGTENLQIRLTVSTQYVIDTPLELYFEDQSFEMGQNGLRTDNTGLPLYGRVAQNSEFYQSYNNGLINTGDYFYQNILSSGQKLQAVEFTVDNIGQSIIHVWTETAIFGSNSETDAQGGDIIYISGTANNDGSYTLLATTADVPGSYSIGGTTYLFQTTFVVDEAITAELAIDSDVTLHDGNPDSIVYLKMYIINDQLYVDFVNSPDIETAGTQTINPNNNPEIIVFSQRANFRQSLEVEAVLESNQFLIDASRYGEVKVGDFVDAYVDTDDLPADYVAKNFTRIINKQVYQSDPSLSVITTDAQVKFVSFNGDQQTMRYTDIQELVDTLKPTVLKGFKMRLDSQPDGTESRQNAILNLLAPGTPIFKGLTNRNKISWRYLVDSFGLGLSSNSKQQLVDLCGARQTSLGLLNMPSAKMFKNSTNPSFTNPDGTLNTEYIRLGGDPQSNPSFLYNFGQGTGQTNVAYFFPYVRISDQGRPTLLPPSSFVANTFMRKFNSRRSDVFPWTVAAGLTNGGITGFGDVEIDFTPDDIEELNDMGANPILFRANRGFVIETNNTAQAVPQTALSSINVREVLIEIENDVYNILLNFQWRFNTPEVRAEIKTRLDALLARYVAQNGIFNFFTVVDETNNTPEIIDAGIGVADIFIEPARAMGVLVANITILRTGSIESGGFTAAT